MFKGDPCLQLSHEFFYSIWVPYPLASLSEGYCINHFQSSCKGIVQWEDQMPGHEDIYIERLEVLNGSCFYHFKKFLIPLKLLMVSSFLGGCFYRYLVMITCLLMVLFSWLDCKLYWRQDMCPSVFLMCLSPRAILPAHCLFVDLFCGHWGNKAFKIESFIKSWFPKEKIICMSSGTFHKKNWCLL